MLSPEKKEIKIVALGDSITRCFGVDPWTDTVTAKSRYKIINKGIGGKKRPKNRTSLDELIPDEPKKEEVKKSPSQMVFDGTRPVIERMREESRRHNEEGGDGILTQAEIDALLMGTEEIDRKVEKEETLSQAEIDQMLHAIAKPSWNDAKQLEFDFPDGTEDVVPVMAPDSIQEEDMVFDGRQPAFDDMGMDLPPEDEEDYHTKLAD